MLFGLVLLLILTGTHLYLELWRAFVEAPEWWLVRRQDRVWNRFVWMRHELLLLGFVLMVGGSVISYRFLWPVIVEAFGRHN